MGLLDRINAELVKSDSHSRDGYLTPSDWVELFQFGGIGYPLVQTTMGSVDEERIGVGANGINRSNAAVFSLVQARIQAFSQVRFQWTRFQGALNGDLFGGHPIRLSETPGRWWRSGPSLGQDTAEMLTGHAGLRPEQVDALFDAGAAYDVAERDLGLRRPYTDYAIALGLRPPDGV